MIARARVCVCPHATWGEYNKILTSDNTHPITGRHALVAELEVQEVAEAEATKSGDTILRDTVLPEDIAGG